MVLSLLAARGKSLTRTSTSSMQHARQANDNYQLHVQKGPRECRWGGKRYTQPKDKVFLSSRRTHMIRAEDLCLRILKPRQKRLAQKASGL